MKLSWLHVTNRWVGIGLFFILFICSFGYACNADASDLIAPLELPEPTGTYGIGTTQLHLTDTTRLEEMTPDPNDHREIMVQIWYPAHKNATGSTVPYTDTQTSAYLMQDLPDDQQDIIGTISTHAIALSLPVVEAAPFPLLIFSPGLGSIYAFHQSLIENAVSHGYVVAALNHPYISGITVFPDGRAVMSADDGDIDLESQHRVVVEDIEFLTGQLESVQIGDATLMPNVNNIGFFGHSFGGSASIEACLQLPQGKCAMNIDGSLRGSSHQQPIEKPLFFILSENHTVSDPSLSAAWRNISRDGYFVNLDGAEHHTFADIGILFYQLYGPDYFDVTKDFMEDTGSIDPQKAIQITREYIVAFFDSYLKDASPNEIAAIDYPEASLVQSSSVDAYDGVWHSTGYGYLLQIEDSDVTVHEITQIGLLPYIQGHIHNNFLYDGDQVITQLSLSDNSIVTSGNGFNYTFKPVEIAPLPTILDKTDDPELNFDVFWQTFEDHFALFDLVPVDWKALYDRYREQITASTTNEELFDLFSTLIVPLNDGHTSITDYQSNRTVGSGPIPNPMWTDSRAAYIDNIARYMDDEQLNSEADGLIRYGVIKDSIGYLNILAFEGYIRADGLVSGEIEKMAFEPYIDAVLEKFEGLDAMILDLRFNTGGHDELALALAGRFTEQKRTAFSKRVRIGGSDEFSAPVEWFVEPSHETAFTKKPLVLLTSNATASAAEVFTMAMEQLDNVTRIGERTYGVFSNMLTRNLPNGWFFTLSNERYANWQGVDYEQQGISPDIEVTYHPAMLEEEKDNALDRSLMHLYSEGVRPCFITSCFP